MSGLALVTFRAEDYLTNGKLLVQVLFIQETFVLVENCSNMHQFTLAPLDWPRWRKVVPESSPTAA